MDGFGGRWSCFVLKGSVVCGFLVINFNIKVNGRNVIRVSYERD